MLKPGVTQELRSRASARIAADSRWRWLTGTVVAVAVVAVCAFLLLRWLA